MISWAIVTCISFAYLSYHLLIGMGWFKTPILGRFERYGVGNDNYTIIPGLVFSFVLLMIGAINLVMHDFLGKPMSAILLIPLAFAIWCLYNTRRLTRRFPGIFLALPRWYAELRENTTREERRRIAYRWLVLPRRARLHYNSNDRAFAVWADFVILATTIHTVEDNETLALASGFVRELYY